MKVEVPARRSTIMDSLDRFEIIIPAKRNIFVVAFLGFWTIGWACGEVFTIWQLFFGAVGHNFSNVFLFAWLGAWTVGGAVAIYTWLWMVNGKERIILRRTTLSTKRDISGFGSIREYDLNHIKNLRVSAQSYNAFDVSHAMSF